MIYDRLGTSLSEKPDAYEIIQGPPQVKILNQLTILACAGKLNGSFTNNQSVTVLIFMNVVAIGHSAGSTITSGLLARHPGVVDGAIFARFLLSSKGTDNLDAHGQELARTSREERLHEYPDGYIVQITINDVQ
jgi:hypothetical protein